jgi:hypothetical protein
MIGKAIRNSFQVFPFVLLRVNSWETEQNTDLGNADSSIRPNREPLSNLTDSTGLQTWKLPVPKKKTEDGIKIDCNPLSQNAYSSIRSNREPLSNLTDSSDQHHWKLHLPKARTEDGIKIDFNPLP